MWMMLLFQLSPVTYVPSVLRKFNSFDKSLTFAVDAFGNEKVYFLDTEISKSGIFLQIYTYRAVYQLS